VARSRKGSPLCSIATQDGVYKSGRHLDAPGVGLLCAFEFGNLADDICRDPEWAHRRHQGRTIYEDVFDMT